MTAGTTTRADAARSLAAAVTDPEMPMLTLADLGVLRGVELHDERVVVTITPTYSGCPAMATMRDDLVHTLRDHGFDDVEVRVSLHPAWSSDWISERGRRALSCPRCGSRDVDLTSEFGPTACKAMYRCTACLEPFEHVKEI